MTQRFSQQLRRHLVPLIFLVVALGFIALPALAHLSPNIPMYGTSLSDYIKAALLLVLIAVYEIVILLEDAYTTSNEGTQTRSRNSSPSTTTDLSSPSPLLSA